MEKPVRYNWIGRNLLTCIAAAGTGLDCNRLTIDLMMFIGVTCYMNMVQLPFTNHLTIILVSCPEDITDQRHHHLQSKTSWLFETNKATTGQSTFFAHLQISYILAYVDHTASPQGSSDT